MERNIYILALAATGSGISGGDRIFIEFARRWSRDNSVMIYVSEDGYEMCRRCKVEISNIKFLISKMESWRRNGFVVNYFAKIIKGVRIGLSLKIENHQDTIIYSASEFWMDSLPAFILKLRFSKIKWVAAWFQTAPNPIVGFSEGERKNSYKINALFYWLAQIPVKPLIQNLAGFVLINNEEEKKQFPKLAKKDRAIVVQGAVDLLSIKNWYKKNSKKELPKIYDAVFEGRFHPQKGVVELIDIWKLVVNSKPDAKLAMIGDGPLMNNVRSRISKLNLENNITIFGYVFDGSEKYKIFSQSKVVVHPAFYDSGGMATAEAMAFGLPGVGFDLKSFKSYYPKGLIKVSTGNLKSFADQVLNLLENTKMRERVGKEAKSMVWASWSWDQRAKEVLYKLGRII